MAEAKTKPRSNGTRKAAKREVPRRKVYDIEELPVERDGVRMFGNVYEFDSASTISAQRLAEIQRLEVRIQEQELATSLSDDDELDLLDKHVAELEEVETDERLIKILLRVAKGYRSYRQAEAQEESGQEMLRLVRLRTATILSVEVPKEVQDKLSIMHHGVIYGSFWDASSADGDRLAKAMEASKTKALASRT